MFKRSIITILFSLVWSVTSSASNPEAVINTNLGKIEIELFQDKSPVTVKNFISYVTDGSYNGTIFHRVIGNFIVQGGHYDINLAPRKRKSPIINEASNGLKNKRGTLAMSRRIGKDSATNQFFMNINDNKVLDHVDNTDEGYGYAVFAKITKGIDILKKIGKVETRRKGVFPKLPLKNIIIDSIEIKKK